MGLTGGTTTNLGLKKARTSEPYDTGWGQDFNDNYDLIDQAIGNLETNKANLSGATFTGEMAIERSSAPGSLSIKGVGNNYNYSQVSLWSAETVDKSWSLIHRKFNDYPNGLIIEQFNGTDYNQRVIITSSGELINSNSLGIGTNSFGSGTNVLAIKNGTAPAASISGGVLLYSEDINGAAGKAGLHMIAESGTNKLVVVGAIIKTTTGDPSQVHEGLMVINTNDRNVKIYAGGAWRTLTTW